MLPSHDYCVLSCLRCNKRSFIIVFIPRIGRSEDDRVCCHAPRTPLTSFGTVLLRTLCTAGCFATLFFSFATSCLPLGELLLRLYGLLSCPVPRKGSGNNNQRRSSRPPNPPIGGAQANFGGPS